MVEQKLKEEEKNNWGKGGKFNNPYLIGKKKQLKIPSTNKYKPLLFRKHTSKYYHIFFIITIFF